MIIAGKPAYCKNYEDKRNAFTNGRSNGYNDGQQIGLFSNFAFGLTGKLQLSFSEKLFPLNIKVFNFLKEFFTSLK